MQVGGTRRRQRSWQKSARPPFVVNRPRAARRAQPPSIPGSLALVAQPPCPFEPTEKPPPPAGDQTARARVGGN